MGGDGQPRWRGPVARQWLVDQVRWQLVECARWMLEEQVVPHICVQINYEEQLGSNIDRTT